MTTDWTLEEVEATVADYFSMLEKEVRGESYNKAEHRRALLKLLSDRSEGAVERKHQNISAVLRDLGHPWIDGYKPLGNYQRLLFDVVRRRVDLDRSVADLIERALSEEVDAPSLDDPLSAWTDPPDRGRSTRISQEVAEQMRIHPPAKIDYLRREATNAKLGLAGEEFVLRFEAERLHRAGEKRLADRIDHVSRSKGDGFGYDILSFDETGRERLIEVKTTRFGKRTPFYVTRNELQCSVEREQEYHLYRVFSFQGKPGIFGVRGRLDRVVELSPVEYVGRW